MAGVSSTLAVCTVSYRRVHTVRTQRTSYSLQTLLYCAELYL